jgi:acyl-CoA thioester hydrolase
MGVPITHRIRVRYAECDAQGVVFNAHYLTFMDVAMTELWRGAGLDYVEMVERGADQVVAEVQLRFLAPARFDEELDLEAMVTRLGTTGMTTRVRMLSVPAGEEVARCEVRHVFVSTQHGDKIPIPDYIRTALTPHAELGQEAAAR